MIMMTRLDPFGMPAAVLLIMAGSYTALAVAARAASRRGTARAAWLAAATVVLGLSVGSTHAAAIAAACGQAGRWLGAARAALPLVVALPLIGIGFLPLCAERPGPVRVFAAGIAMGLGISVIHYLGLAALIGATMAYDPPRVIGFVMLVMAACGLALLLAVRRRAQGAPITAALALGATVAAAHCASLSAVSFQGSGPWTLPPALPVAGLATAVVTATLALCGLALALSLVDRRIVAVAARETALIRRSEQYLRAVLEQLPLGIGIADSRTGRLTVVNRHAHALLGETFDLSRLDPAAVVPGAVSASSAAAIGGGAGRLVEHGHADGRHATLEVWAAPLFNAQGEQDQAVYAFQDVSARLRAEAELRQAQKMEAVGQLTGGIAHDFNNLLTAILGNLDLLEPRVDGEAARLLLRNAVEAAERGARLTTQLLGFSRRQSLRTEMVDVNAVVAGLADLLESTPGGTIRIARETGTALWPALADRTQLELVILNLAINARDAMPLGGTITIRTDNVRAEAPVGAADPPAGHHVLLSVSDNGTGMPPETLARVFEPFFTTKPPGKGSGLGLSQVLGIAQQLGGGVRILSARGEGTEVQMFIPRGAGVVPAADAATPPPAIRAAPLAGRGVLLVDDDRDVRLATRATLELLGCVVTEAASGRDALDHVLGTRGALPDAVLMDHAMPGMTGREAAARIREIFPDMPILMITGYAGPDLAGVAGDRFPVLHKPFRAAALSQSIGALLQGGTGGDGSVVPFPSGRGGGGGARRVEAGRGGLDAAPSRDPRVS